MPGSAGCVRQPRGAAAVEFALVLPVLMLIVFGTIEWGRYFYIRESVVHAAREGARGGTLVGGGTASACGAAQAYLDAIGLTPSCPGDISVTIPHPVALGGANFDGVRVVIDMEFNSLTGLPLALPQRVGATAVMPLPNN